MLICEKFKIVKGNEIKCLTLTFNRFFNFESFNIGNIYLFDYSSCCSEIFYRRLVCTV